MDDCSGKSYVDILDFFAIESLKSSGEPVILPEWCASGSPAFFRQGQSLGVFVGLQATLSYCHPLQSHENTPDFQVLIQSQYKALF